MAIERLAATGVAVPGPEFADAAASRALTATSGGAPMGRSFGIHGRCRRQWAT